MPVDEGLTGDVRLVVPPPRTAASAYVHTDTTDQRLVELWLHDRPPNTQAAYRYETERFLAFVGVGLRDVYLGDLQAFEDSLGPVAPATRKRAIAAVKSLLRFGFTVGYLVVDVGRARKLPKVNNLVDHILDEPDVMLLIHQEPEQRNQVILQLLYVAGLRVAELGGLRWRDVQRRDAGGQITVRGKGDKPRVILLPERTWRNLLDLRGDRGPDEPILPGRHGALTSRAIRNVVYGAARRAGLEANVSPHWLRHSHATHAIERGAPIHLVQATLGHASVATTGRYLHARPTDSSSRYLAQ